jgi:hypothetical protein
MNNRLYFLGKWFEKNKITIILIYSLCAILHLVIPFMFGINELMYLDKFLIPFLILFNIFRLRLNHIPLDKSKFSIPEKDEVVLIKKEFYYDGNFRKYVNHSDHSRKPNTLTFKKGSELTVTDVITLLNEEDWVIYMEDQDGNQIKLLCIETRNYWETKSNFRENRLKELGI